jgi:TetR/AcrR family fatty acid metabolism transcriptional regulator
MTLPLATRVAQFKQDRILDAALSVFATKGFHAASMRDVAAAAGIAPGSIYNHFENKAALLIAIFDRMSDRAQAAPPAVPAGAGLRELLVATLGLPLAGVAGETAALFRVLLAEVLVNRDLAEAFRRRVLAPMLSSCGATLAGHLPPASREAWLGIVSAIVLGLILQRLLDPDGPPPAIDPLAEALLAGLRNAAR